VAECRLWDFSSASIIEHFEYFQELKPGDFAGGHIDIVLEKRRRGSALEKRISKWLRLRRKNPDSPVLMRAISIYLCGINELEEGAFHLS